MTTDASDLAPNGQPKMVIGKTLWDQLNAAGEDMRFYRLSKALPLDANKLFKQH